MVLTKNISRKAALRFLQSGDDGGADMHVLVMECDRVVRQDTEKSSASAVRLGRRFVDRVRPYQGGLLATALRAYGWALLVSGKYTEAKKAYLEARALMRRDVSGRARIDRVLIDVYMYLGDFKEAQRRVRLAMAAFRKSGDEAEAAKTRINHANLRHRQDRHHAAGKLYREAGEFFENQGAELLVAFCHYNEANTLVQLFDFRKATSLYRKARQIFLRHDYDLRANGCLDPDERRAV